MNVSLPVGASIRRVAQIIHHACVFGSDGWGKNALPALHDNGANEQAPFASEQDVIEVFSRLNELHIPYLLVGGVALLKYVQGRNTEDIDILMSLPSLQQIPGIIIEDQNEYFIRARFKSLRVDVLLTDNPFFSEVQHRYATTHRFLEIAVSCATVEGLLALKLYALPSLYRQGDFERVGLYENDIAALIQGYHPTMEPLWELLARHLAPGPMTELRNIYSEILERIERFEKRSGR